MKKNTFIILILGLLLLSCKKKDSLRWNVDVLAPVVYGDLTIKNIINDSLWTANTDSSIQLNFTSTLYSLNFDSIVSIPDTTIKENHLVPFSAGITFNPGQTFVTQTNDVNLDIDDIELTEVIIKEGNINYTISSNIDAEIIYTYKINNAFDAQGNPFSKELTVPPSGSSNAVLSGSFSLANYRIDLTGANGVSYNRLSTNVEMTLSPNNPTSVLINNQDTVHTENTLTGLKVEYAKGYFGNRVISVPSETSAIKALHHFISGVIDVEQVNIDFKIINGIGADASFTINEMTSIRGTNEVGLIHNLIGNLTNISRAGLSGNTVIPTVFNTSITSSNSNIEPWLENIPDSIRYAMDLELNPLGDVSGHNDFIYSSSPFKVQMGVNMPLSLLANNLTLLDTITLSIEKLKQVVEGKLKIEIDNGFPLSATLSIQPVSGGNELASNTTIESGALDNGTQKVVNTTHSSHTITLTDTDIEALKNDGRVLLRLVFNTPVSASTPIKIYDYYHLKFSVVTDFTYTNKID